MGGARFDLNGHQQALASLAETHSADLITNSSGNPSALTITSGGGTYAESVFDGSGRVSLVMSGTGRQVLTGSSSYSGGTKFSADKLGTYGTTAPESGVVDPTGGVASLGRVR